MQGAPRNVALSNPPNPWASTDVEYLEEVPRAELHVYEDHTKQILSRNDSPDIPFTWSANPYRGCMHACAYCYARPTHEYLSFGAGTDFDTRIVVKPDAPRLLREALQKRSWKGEPVVFSGVTDCYQPLEASYRLTRACLEVCLDMRNPVSIITKSPLVERDLDLLEAIHRVASVSVAVSIPFWDPVTARAIEPLVTTPARRVRILERLSARGLPVGVMVAPVIPGLSDRAIPEVLTAARAAGAEWAGYVLLRLPGSVKQVFAERVRAALPLAADKILARIEDTRDGEMYDPRWGHRQTGQGPYAEMIAALFRATSRKLGFSEEGPKMEPVGVERRSKQLSLFPEG